MPRNNSRTRKAERRVQANGRNAYWESIPLSVKVALIAERPGNSYRELKRLTGRDLRVTLGQDLMREAHERGVI